MVYDEIIVGGDPGEGNGFLVEYNAADVTGSSNNNCRFTGVAVGDYKIDCVAKLTHHPTWDTSGQAEPFVIKEESFTVIVGRPNSVVDSVPPVTCSGTSEVYQGSERMNSSCTYRLAAKQTDGSFLVVGSGSDSKSVTFSVSAPWTSAFNPLIPLFHSPLLAFK